MFLESTYLIAKTLSLPNVFKVWLHGIRAAARMPQGAAQHRGLHANEKLIADLFNVTDLSLARSRMVALPL